MLLYIHCKNLSMLLSTLLHKFGFNLENKKVLIRKVIEQLHIDESQKDLYEESLDVLDSERLDELYERLQDLLASFEENEAIQKYKIHEETLHGVRKKEVENAAREANSAAILLDSI